MLTHGRPINEWVATVSISRGVDHLVALETEAGRSDGGGLEEQGPAGGCEFVLHLITGEMAGEGRPATIG